MWKRIDHLREYNDWINKNYTCSTCVSFSSSIAKSISRLVLENYLVKVFLKFFWLFLFKYRPIISSNLWSLFLWPKTSLMGIFTDCALMWNKQTYVFPLQNKTFIRRFPHLKFVLWRLRVTHNFLKLYRYGFLLL